MSIRYFKKIYSIAFEEGLFSAIKYDFKATLFCSDSRMCRLIDYISDYFVVRDIRSANKSAANEMQKRLELSRRLTKEVDLEMLLNL